MAKKTFTITLDVTKLPVDQEYDMAECIQAAMDSEDFWAEALAGSGIFAKVKSVTVAPPECGS